MARFAHRLEHELRLIGRDDFVVESLKENDGAGEFLDEVNRRTASVDVGLLRVGTDQGIQVTGLELVSVTSENLQVADAVIRSAGFEQISEC